MDKYTIYCTEEQTRKALELGAPIKSWENITTASANEGYYLDGTTLVKLPTAEQMIGWLEEQGIKINIEHSNVEDSMRFKIHKSEDFDYEIAWNFHYPSRTEATLAAIDAALDYLIKNKK